jgi:hypothetical protein
LINIGAKSSTVQLKDGIVHQDKAADANFHKKTHLKDESIHTKLTSQRNNSKEKKKKGKQTFSKL